MSPAWPPLWVVRHARLAQPVAGCYGASDLPADAAHTRERARQLAGVLPEGARLLSSTLSRARQLADGVREHRPDLSAVREDRRLNEMDFGRWEGRSWDDIGACAVEGWVDDFSHHRCGGGESVADVLVRVQAAWLDRCDDAGGVSPPPATRRPVVWFTHAGVIRALQYLSAFPPGRWPMPAASHWPCTVVAHGGCMRMPSVPGPASGEVEVIMPPPLAGDHCPHHG